MDYGAQPYRARVSESALAQASAIPADALDTLAELRRRRGTLRAGSTVH